MRYISLLFIPLLALAQIHYARIEPYDSAILKSAVSAQVISADIEAEGRMIADEKIIQLDDKLDKADLKASENSLKLLESMLGINEDMLSSLSESLERQLGYFKRIDKLSTASRTQKDNAFNSFVSTKNQYLSTKEKMESLKKQINDLSWKIEKLRDTISKKNITVKNRYLYKLSVRAGDFVNPGSPLAVVQDLSRGKLTIFLERSEMEGIDKKSVYIDDKKTTYKVDKIWKVTDDKFVSSYRAEIYVDRPEGYFSKLVKVELK